MEERAFQENPKRKDDPNGNALGTAADPGLTRHLDNNVKFSELTKFSLYFDLNSKILIYFLF